MPLPTFAQQPSAVTRSMNINAAAAALKISRASCEKLIACGVVPTPIDSDLIGSLASRPRLVVAEGELTVLRTAPRSAAREPDREWIGFDVGFSVRDLTAASLRWWRCDPNRILDNELFAVTVATVPVAVYAITALEESHQVPGEAETRHRFVGDLLARWGEPVAPGIDSSLKVRVEQIMSSRISVSSGGPIGYLNAE
ncbi:hypothetical protein NS506_02624 [Nocardia seriolae]|uniref:DNA-binding protein n=2 Tax=Nocardia seriolae TaxID=37332 RepID=A0ABC8AR80_9NOCA|nr:hypothetical protein NS506_02624 [Nocardia seriolae]BEK93876.1 hypothetical protein NSER024013_17820 [Nocardia seriolae]GEM27781.1 hypothetical protein NS2_60200 [Nocardia seriolae NBRC 15557]